MPVLAEGSFIPRAHIVRKRSSCRPQQSARGFGLEIANLSHGDSEFSWISRILPSIYPRFLQDRQADDKASSEGSQVYLDIRLRGSFPAVENFVDHCASFDSTRHHQVVRCILRCIRNRSWLCLNARRKGYCLCFPPVEKT